MSGGRLGQPGDSDTVVVPTAPGPLLRPGLLDTRGRERDDLDELIDELLPDSSEGPGVADAALVGGGAALLGWSALGSPPVAATVAGAVALGLGCILPLRAAWRRVADRRRARARRALMARGVPLSTTDPALVRLVAVYEEMEGLDAIPETARAAAHAALVEVATLLGGRTPSSAKERAYVAARTASVEELVAALAEVGTGDTPDGTGLEAPGPDPDLVVEAREELDALGGGGSLTRLDDAIAEVRSRGRRL